MLRNKQMQQPNAINKPDSILSISIKFYRSHWLGRPTARPALIPSLWHPGSEKPECTVFQPKDRGEVFWNTVLLDIEQISSYYNNNNTRVWCYKEAQRHGDTMPAILHLLYASSRTTRSSGNLLAAEQRRRWRTPICRDSGWDTI